MKKGYLYILFATFFFSTMEIALKLTSGAFQAIQLTFLRFLIGSLILLIPALRETKKRKTSFHKRDWLFFCGNGFLCVVISMILFQLSVLYSPAGVVAVLFSCNSVFVILFAFLLLGEKIRRHTVISILLSLIGMIVIANPAHLASSKMGLLLILGSAVTFALYNVVGRTRSAKFGGVAVTCFSFLFGCAEMFLLILISRIPAVAAAMKGAGLTLFADIPIFSGITPLGLLGLLYVGIFVTGLGYACYFLAMEATGAATASLVFYIKPILAPLFAMVLLGEPITPQMVCGIILILAGSFITFVPNLRMQKPDEHPVRERAD